MQTDTMNVTGMRCGGCVNKIELALNGVVGVDSVQTSLASGEVTVVYDEAVTSPPVLEERVLSVGFGVHGIPATNGHDPRPDQCG